MELTPSDRVNLISEIATRLGREEWKIIDLTLRQYRLPWQEDWRGSDRSEYVIQMIDDTDDDVLISLGTHLSYDFEPSRPQIEPDFWERGYFRLFISHLANSPWQNLDFLGLCSFRTLALRWPNDGFQERKTANRAGTTPRNAPKGDSWLSSAPLGPK